MNSGCCSCPPSKEPTIFLSVDFDDLWNAVEHGTSIILTSRSFGHDKEQQVTVKGKVTEPKPFSDKEYRYIALDDGTYLLPEFGWSTKNRTSRWTSFFCGGPLAPVVGISVL